MGAPPIHDRSIRRNHACPSVLPHDRVTPRNLAHTLPWPHTPQDRGVTKGVVVSRIGQLVHFRIRDVFIPDPKELLMEMYGDNLLQGTVDAFTDSGFQQEAFVVLSVEGIHQPVIIAADRIQASDE